MKLRIKGNSIRLRVSQPEMAALLREGRIVETICFGAAADARLSYGLEVRDAGREIALEYRDGAVMAVLSASSARRWAESEDVGVYGDVETGDGAVALLVEKDFACLDGDDPQDEDAFPNPKTGVVC